MNNKAFVTLEYFKIIELLENKAISVMGKEFCKNLKPSIDLVEIETNQSETSESTSVILKKGSLPLGGLKDIRKSLQRVSIQGVLSVEELLHIGDFLYTTNRVISYGNSENKNDSLGLLENSFAELEKVPSLEKEINKCIISEIEISDDASSTLNNIRRNIKSANTHIKEQLNTIIHSNHYKNMLQDPVVTIRNGRYCVPIKQEYRGDFQGMIHDQSATGQTLFIEPASVVNLNNKIKELEANEKSEIIRILTYLSELVEQNRYVFENNLRVLTYLDFVFAKGELSILMNGSKPEFNKNGYVNIKKGRHPLLKGNVVPIDIYLGNDFTTLLITGPNTGGKTVSLKTLGLFTLMGQAGLHISALDHSELNVFDNVFADIGDEQSIEQNLSTFSGHMTNIVNILDKVTSNSLVLLDELGAGTDPTEGAALAIAILQALHKQKIRCAVTTHYSELKVYALSTEGVENAACEFDIETLKPTFKLLIGVPGKSNAFAISRRLGLSDNIINDAKELLSHENVKFEDLLTDLEISRKTVELEQEKAEDFRRETERLKSDLETRKLKLENQKNTILEKAKREAYDIKQKAKDESDYLIKELQKQIKENAMTREIHEIRTTLSENLTSAEKELAKPTLNKKNIVPIKRKLVAGDKVFVHSLNQSAIVLSVEPNNEIMVQSGIMKIKINKKDLSLDETKDVKVKNTFTRSVKKGKSSNMKPELDMRGNMVDEGLEKLGKYLDDAYLSGVSQVTIIHGKGTGALRNAVQDFLKYNSHVKSFRLGEFGEGDSGVTIVEF